MLTPNFSSFCLQIAKKIKITFFFKKNHFWSFSIFGPFLAILVHFGHFLGNFLALFRNFRSANLVLVFLVSFGPFAQTFQSILGHFLAILSHICQFWVIFGHFRVILVIWVVFVYGWYGWARFGYIVEHLFPCMQKWYLSIWHTLRNHC